MAENSKIEWTNHTFNPWMGCTAISPACDHCYAETQTARFKQVEWGARADRKRTSIANWKKPLAWNRKAEQASKRQKVFCASLADVFDNHKSILPEWRDELWALIRATPWLDWLLLTKRPQNIAKFLPDDWGNGYRNVWLGVTVENQEEAERRIPILLNTKANLRFLSVEPVLSTIDWKRWLPSGRFSNGQFLEPAYYMTQCDKCGWAGSSELCGSDFDWDDSDVYCPSCQMAGADAIDLPYLNWVICGGESGPSARPMHPDWARALRDQCVSAGVPFFFKQWGEWVPFLDRDIDDPDWRAGYSTFDRSDRHCFINIEGGCGFHGDRLHVMHRVGKKQAGNLLDGKQWQQMPEVCHE